MRTRLFLLGIAIAIAGFSARSPGAFASFGFTVNSTADQIDANPGDGICATSGGACTLRAAVQEANHQAAADIINLPAGTYTLEIPGNHEDNAAQDDLDILDDLTITGADQATTVIDGNAKTRIFDVIPNSIKVQISGVTVRNGMETTTGGAIDNHADLTLTDVTISGSAGPEGGAISNSGNLSLTRVTLDANTADDAAGGLWNEPAATATIQDSTLTHNQSTTLHASGGAIFNEGTLEITGSTIQNNTTAGSGGGVATAGDLTVSDSTVSDNTATDSGGGIWLDEGGAVTVTNSHVDGNSTQGGGGGVELAGNQPFTITNSTISGNDAMSGGGGIDILQDAAVTVRNSTIANNQAHEYPGGGIAQDSLSPLTVDKVTFSGNTAQNGGGISLFYNGPTTITNSTFSGNSAVGPGGAIWRSSATPVMVLNSTIAGNSGDGSGGIFTDTASGSFAFKNTIIASNTGGDCAFSNGAHAASQGHNLISDDTCNFNASGDLENTDPKLGLLGNNGGDTQTMALQPDSPALDAGTNSGCPSEDQRGKPRPVDGPDPDSDATCDIGAFEYGNEATPTPSPTQAPQHKQGDVDCSGVVNSVDALKELRFVAHLSVSQEPQCPEIGSGVASLFGDVDCNDSVNSVDALKLLRFVAHLSVAQDEPCVDIGDPE